MPPGADRILPRRGGAEDAAGTGKGSRQARARVWGRRGSAGRSLGFRGREPRAGQGRAGGTPWPLPCPEGCGPPGAGSGARPLPRSGSYGSVACSRRRLRCQQTPGASLPGPPLSNSEPVSPNRPAANASDGDRRFRGPEAAPLPGPGPVCRGRRQQVSPHTQVASTSLRGCPWPLRGPLV